ncbi:hypothetical protein H9M94_00965 [Mycoplasma sp. Pen4]|uniref:hypothetical protein n=1 Tax=Mycoplasma sp. Pen4 TaxID=640330 RepID=UPI0016549B41|nr:hypothetical protein [Mycoplasma sp. Pen4]QNM93830.1 hypothetical protein H9M94_00965 [Mycoplasma sp. Pen4]
MKLKKLLTKSLVLLGSSTAIFGIVSCKMETDKNNTKQQDPKTELIDTPEKDKKTETTSSELDQLRQEITQDVKEIKQFAKEFQIVIQYYELKLQKGEELPKNITVELLNQYKNQESSFALVANVDESLVGSISDLNQLKSLKTAFIQSKGQIPTIKSLFFPGDIEVKDIDLEALKKSISDKQPETELNNRGDNSTPQPKPTPGSTGEDTTPSTPKNDDEETVTQNTVFALNPEIKFNTVREMYDHATSQYNDLITEHGVILQYYKKSKAFSILRSGGKNIVLNFADGFDIDRIQTVKDKSTLYIKSSLNIDTKTLSVTYKLKDSDEEHTETFTIPSDETPTPQPGTTDNSNEETNTDPVAPQPTPDLEINVENQGDAFTLDSDITFDALKAMYKKAIQKYSNLMEEKGVLFQYYKTSRAFSILKSGGRTTVLRYKDGFNPDDMVLVEDRGTLYIKGTFYEANKTFVIKYNLKNDDKEYTQVFKLSDDTSASGDSSNSGDNETGTNTTTEPQPQPEPEAPTDGNTGSSNEENVEVVPNTSENLLTSLAELNLANEYLIKTTHKTAYVRPPFGAQFTVNALGSGSATITTIFDHLDSPGAKSSKNVKEPAVSRNEGLPIASGAGQGAQEFSEFMALPNVAAHYQGISNPKNLTIFGGDTNIKTKNFYLQNYFEPYFKAVITQPKTELKTSLNTKGGYSEMYDKMFYANKASDTFMVIDDKVNPLLEFKYDIYRVFMDGLVSEELKNHPSYSGGTSSNNAVSARIRSRLSDHAPVFTDVAINSANFNNPNLDMLTNSKNAKSLRIAHWNILNFGTTNPRENIADKYAFKYMGIAAVAKAKGFDIIGLTEVNEGAQNNVEYIVQELNRLYGRNVWRSLITSPGSMLHNNQYAFLSNGGKEETAILYNSELVSPTQFTTGNVTELFKGEIPAIKPVLPGS